ncbi:acyl-CoA carboxylase subunit beta [Streptomyces sp. NPDC023998]|uniref:acyl-CoA carboxylase subunit beta n=1 Tax=Streptomyces sp. NPDC023998 TaxID=3154597 RepID=UPI0033E83285
MAVVTDTDARTATGRMADLRRRIDDAVHAGSDTVQDPHTAGGTTARELLEQLFDDGSFMELDAVARHRADNVGAEKTRGRGSEMTRDRGEGLVTGYGEVDGRPVAVFCQDVTVSGGALDEFHGEKITKVMDFALKTGCPLIGINDCGAARIQEGAGAPGVHGEVLRRNVHASGVIPQISLIMGSCTRGAVHSPALMDFVVMVDQTSRLFINGPEVIKTVTGEDVGFEELGGARTHSTSSGVAHHLAADEEDAVEYVKALLSYLPSNNLEEPPVHPEPADAETGTESLVPELDRIVPDTANQPYDMRKVIEPVLDDGEFLETQALFAPNIVTGFGRVEGHPVGIVANQPMHFAGCLDVDACEKAARLIRTCDAFNVPVLTFVDVPGFRPGVDQEYSGIVRHGAKLIYAYAEATVPLITVVTRKACGGAYDVMGSKHLGTDLNLSWPTAQIAVMGAHGLDAVIRPSETRQHIIRGLRALRSKRETLPPKKHGNIPL